MKSTILFLLLVVTAPALAIAATDLPLLEEYNFELSSDWSKLEFQMLDPQLAQGGAQFRMEVRPIGKGKSRIHLEVFRHVPKETIMFALLLEEIRLQFSDAQGKPVHTIVLDQILGPSGLFVISDSGDGFFEYSKTVTGLKDAGRLQVQIFGNYE